MKRRAFLWAGLAVTSAVVGTTLVTAVRGPCPIGPLRLPTTRVAAVRSSSRCTPPARCARGGPRRSSCRRRRERCALVKLVSTGNAVKTGDVVFEIDPADRSSRSSRRNRRWRRPSSKSSRPRPTAPCRRPKTTVALLTARYDVRRGELDTAANDLDRRDRRAEEHPHARGSASPARTARAGREVAYRDQPGGAGGRAASSATRRSWRCSARSRSSTASS